MKKTKLLATVICLSLFTVIAVGCGTTSDSKPKKVGEVSKDSKSDDSKDDSSKKAETKSEYHVGDIVKDGDMEIVYVASGEYIEENEFMQPQDGNKYVFIKMLFDNKGKSDETVSSFSFKGYADGYSVEQHYTDNDLSATLSSGRTTEGMVIFEVPNDAQNIEFEYETNIITDEKIKFVYDGDKESGYVAEGDTSGSENAFKVGDVVESKDLNISYLSCENDTSYSEFNQPAEGCHYVTLSFEFENKGSSDENVSMFDFDCYADGKACEQSYFRDDNLSATISAGRKAQGTVTFEVPDGATVVEAEFVSDIWTSSRVVFTISE